MIKKISFIFIIILAFFLRFWRLSSYPALNADEAAIGYNAYSIIQTGFDEHGESWPLHFRSFDDYKPGMYFYLTIPFVWILGLNILSVRLVGALAGVATVGVVYLLSSFLVKEIKTKNKIYKKYTPMLSALFLAISPWHIHFSRGAWEVSVATLFITLGLYLFLKWTKFGNFRYLITSFIFLVFSMYTYHSARVIVPLMTLGLFVIYRNVVLKNLKDMYIAGFISFIFMLPLGAGFFGPSISSRASGVAIFADTGIVARINEQRGMHDDPTSIWAVAFHNKAVNYTLEFLENWLEHFNGEFLFLSGDVIERNRVPETGQMYIVDILFLTLGLYSLFRKSNLYSKTIIFWVLIAPVAAAMTFQSPHALRSQNMVVPLTIISAFGASFLISVFVKLTKIRVLFGSLLAAVSLLLLWNFVRYQHMYWVHMSKEYPYSSQYGVAELADYVNAEKDKYERIFITTRYDQPYILLAFYTKYTPATFQKERIVSNRDNFGFSTTSQFSNYVFGPIDFEKIRSNYKKSLIVGTDEEIPVEADIIHEIYGTNGYKYFQVARI